MKKLKSQMITEFMIAAPLLILFFIVLTEFSFALNAAAVFQNSVKSSISAYLQGIAVEKKKSDYEKMVRDYVISDMQNNKLPNTDSITVNLLTVDNYPVVAGEYTYKPGFTFAFLPALRTIKIQTASVFPFPLLDLSGYQSSKAKTDAGVNSLTPTSGRKIYHDDEWYYVLGNDDCIYLERLVKKEVVVEYIDEHGHIKTETIIIWVPERKPEPHECKNKPWIGQ